MKKQIIRIGVFETNSSSAHSISIADETKKFFLEPLYPDENGVITLCGGEYGWDWFKTNETEEKANYAAQQFSNNQDMLDMLTEIILETTGALNVVYGNLDDGYIDHDSVGILPKDKVDLKNFIFNKNSWLFGGNDNSTAAPTFYDVAEYTEQGIIEPTYKYELVIDGYPETAKFKQYPTEEMLDEAFDSLLGGVYVMSDGKTFDLDTSILNRMTRDDDSLYEYSNYKAKRNDEAKKLPFIKSHLWNVAQRIYDKTPESKTMKWGKGGYQRVSEIERGLLDMKNSPYIVWIDYHINNI